MSASVVVVTLSPEELAALVRAAVEEALVLRAPAAPPVPPPEWLDAAGAEAMTGFGRRHLVRSGAPVHRVGGRLRFRRGELEAWMQARAAGGAPAPGARVLSLVKDANR